VDETSEEGSFLESLLGAMTGSNTTAVDQGVAAGKLQFVSEEFQEVLWTPMEERLGHLSQKATVTENTPSACEPNALTEILGALSDAGEGEKQTDLLAALVKENTNKNQSLVRGSLNVDPKGPENGLPTVKVLETKANADLIASDVTMDDAQKPTVGEGMVGGSSQGKAVVAEGLFSQTMKDLVQRVQGNDPKTPVTETLDRVILSDSTLPEGKGGTTHGIPGGEELSTPQITEPSTWSEGVTTPNRPVSALLGDGLMAQVLEGLNLKTWRAGQREMRIQLQPPELGRVHMKIGLDNHHVVLRINVENPFVKDLIENNLAQLRQSLEDQGLRMDQCAVTVSDHDETGFGGNHENAAGSSGHDASVKGGETAEPPPQRMGSAYWGDSDLVNVFI